MTYSITIYKTKKHSKWFSLIDRENQLQDPSHWASPSLTAPWCCMDVSSLVFLTSTGTRCWNTSPNASNRPSRPDSKPFKSTSSRPSCLLSKWVKLFILVTLPTVMYTCKIIIYLRTECLILGFLKLGTTRPALQNNLDLTKLFFFELGQNLNKYLQF